MALGIQVFSYLFIHVFIFLSSSDHSVEYRKAYDSVLHPVLQEYWSLEPLLPAIQWLLGFIKVGPCHWLCLLIGSQGSAGGACMGPSELLLCVLQIMWFSCRWSSRDDSQHLQAWSPGSRPKIFRLFTFVKSEFLLQEEKFKYLKLLFTTEEFIRPVGAPNHCGEVGADAGGKAFKLPVNLHSEPNPWWQASCSNWRMSSKVQATKISFFYWVVCLTLRDRVTGLDIWREWGVEQLLSQVERSQSRQFRNLIRTLLGTLLRRFFMYVWGGGNPRVDSEHTEIRCLIWFGKDLGSPRRSSKMLLWRCPRISCRGWIDAWMEGWRDGWMARHQLQTCTLAHNTKQL